jgi:hypothetical protein
MQKLSRIVAVAAVAVCVPAGLLMAQNAPATGSDTTAAPAPAPAATTSEPAATTPAPAATTSAPATTTSAPAATTSAPAATAPATTQNDQPMKKKKTAKMTRQQEIDKSIDSGTVPSRYRKQVPKEYQQYIPFSK